MCCYVFLSRRARRWGWGSSGTPWPLTQTSGPPSTSSGGSTVRQRQGFLKFVRVQAKQKSFLTCLLRIGSTNRTYVIFFGLTSFLLIPGGFPMRSYSWRRHNHPFTLSFLEEVLRWVGMNEVHKAVTLLLDTLAKQPGSPRIQRWVSERQRLMAPTRCRHTASAPPTWRRRHRPSQVLSSKWN